MSASQTPLPKSLLGLPAELRDEIFELAIIAEGPEREVDVFSRCKPRSSLMLVSKQIYGEVEKVIERNQWPCRHILFSFTLWGPELGIQQVHETIFGGRGGMRRPKDHDMNDAECLRVIAINSGNNNPLAVTVTFPYPAAPARPLLEVYGATNERQSELEARFIDTMRAIKSRQQDGTKHKMLEEILIQLRIAIHRVW
ncbi:hypothetical protein LTR85_006597 [Meristemomyces frigidus]|nr:hypothetical protein LTR85_006597 [Meristemomyces frigidus]